MSGTYALLPCVPSKPNRYDTELALTVLYLSLSLETIQKWCHRVKLVVEVLGLQSVIGVTTLIDDPIQASRGGWVFRSRSDSKFDVSDLRELYDLLHPQGTFQGRCTAPLLVDLKLRRIVSNESSDMVRTIPQLTQLLQPQTSSTHEASSTMTVLDLYPTELESVIEGTNIWVYRLLNNGVYRCGFSTSQEAYNTASADVQEGLSKCQELLSQQPFLCGETFTETDVLLFPTMIRFDGVYAPLFKAGGSHIRLECDYPAIYAWMKRCWQTIPGVSTSIDIADATSSYYKQLFPLNPGGILPTVVTARHLRLDD